MTLHPLPIFAVSVLAEAAISVAEPSWQPWAQYGLAGFMLAWLMLRVEKRIDRLIDALNLNSYTTSTAILDTKHKDEAITQLTSKLQAQAADALKNAPQTSTRRG